jgi:hypothetical protein
MVDSSSEDAADDDDTDFELDSGSKRKRNIRPNAKPQKESKVLLSKPGDAAEVQSWTMKVDNCVVFAGKISEELQNFLQKHDLCAMYTRGGHTQEVKLCPGKSTVTLNDTCLTFSKTNPTMKQKIPAVYFWDRMQFMKSTRGSGDGIRNICFQNDDGLVITFDMDGLMGDYSKFKT